MIIKDIELKHFRNYDHQELVFDPLINIFVGDNAQGKTNALEAIYLLSSSRSFKTHIIEDMIQFNEQSAVVSGHVISNNRPITMKIALTKKGKKAFINMNEIARTSDYIGYFNAILFLPEDLQLIQGSPRLRRRLLDQEIAKISPIYAYNLAKYQSLLKERNAYLKQLSEQHKQADTYLDVLSEQLASLQVDLINRRQAFVSLLNEFSQSLYQYIAEDEALQITYHCQYKEISEQAILAKYQDNYSRDIMYRTTVDGIHKDDLHITLNQRNATLYASQGQQRSIVLAMKIALLEIVRKEVGEYPILLLDDVLSELDDTRKEKLLNLISNKIQTFMTTTSLDGIDHEVVKKAKKLVISSGHLEGTY